MHGVLIPGVTSVCLNKSLMLLFVSLQGTCSSAVTQKFTYMLMKTGTLVLKVQTDMKGYTAGQIIQVNTKIHNQSGKSTGNMAASLVQVNCLFFMLIDLLNRLERDTVTDHFIVFRE